MKTLKRISQWFKKLRTREKIMAAAAFVMTAALLVTVPTVAWFAHQKHIATMAKVNSPAKLSLKSGAGEDIINFKMSGIDTTKGNSKSFVFCVEGEDITLYNIQLAHTTNINFKYKLYKAKPSENTDDVVYESENGKQYYHADAQLVGDYINDEQLGIDSRTIGNDQYEKPSYDNNENRQQFAEPVYWQNDDPINARDEEYDYDDAERAFRNYYVLEVSWNSSVKNDKETDLIYLTAQVA
ncbi:MAG: hypothetical protein IKH90_00760 [Ruminococcus sp.]|nr:hypothetical protein [Ruminococcus sp.]